MANTWRTEMQTMESDVLAGLATELGEQVTYSHRSAAGVKVYCIPSRKEPAKMKPWENIITVELPRNFRIPKQTGFPPSEGIFPGDTVTDENSTVYVVDSVKQDDLDGVFILNCVNTITKTAGIREK